MFAIVTTLITIINYYYITYHYLLVGFANVNNILYILVVIFLLHIVLAISRIYNNASWLSLVYLLEVVSSSFLLALCFLFDYHIILL